MKDDSNCPKNILCDFKRIGDYYDALVEVCRNCGKKIIYGKKFEIKWREDGNWYLRYEDEVDPSKYLRDHIRDTLQPYGRTGKLYRQIYGLETVKAMEKLFRGKKTKQQIKAEWEDTRKDALKFVRTRTLGALGPRGTDWS